MSTHRSSAPERSAPFGDGRRPGDGDASGPPTPPGAWTATQARLLADTAPDAFALLDGTGRILGANTRFARVTGVDADALVGRLLDEVWTVDPEPGQPGDLPDLLERVRREASVRVEAHRAGAGAEADAGHHRLVLHREPDGRFGAGVDVGAAAGPVEVTAPSVTGSAGAGTAEASLGGDRVGRVDGVGRVDLGVDDLVTGIAVYALDGRVVHVNEAMCRLFGRNRDELPAATNLLVHRDDRAAGVELGVRAYCGEIDGWTRQKRLIRPDGQLVWVEETVRLVRDARGTPLRYVAQHVDLTETRRLEAALRERDAEVLFLADGLPVALVEVDKDGRITRSNSAARDLLGREPVGLGLGLADVVHPDDLGRVRRAVVAPADDRGDRGDRQLEFRLRDAGPGDRWVRAQARLHVDRRGRLVRAVSTWTDITEEVEARDSSARLADLLESVQDLVAVTDLDGRVTYLNGIGRLLLGVDGDGTGHRLVELFAPESAAEIEDVALSTVRHFGSWQGEVRMRPPGMDPRVVSLSLVAHVDERRGQQSISAITRDITELKRAEEAMRRQATTDALTGLPNRTIFLDRLTHALARAGRNGGRVALLFVDLDRFKAVNDRMGHHAGDEVLVEVARRLEACVRGCDTVARLGGDEFVVLVEPVLRHEDALVVAHRIVTSLSQPVVVGSGVAEVGASVGLALSERDSTARSLLDQADAAVYDAKAAGRCRVVVHGA